jgi:hypothetical protein
VQGIQLSTLEATANWLSALYEVFNLLFGLDKFYSNIGLTSFCLWKTKAVFLILLYIFYMGEIYAFRWLIMNIMMHVSGSL